jgi:hypothetical protein
MAQQNTEPVDYISEIQLGDEKPVRCVYFFVLFSQVKIDIGQL